ncbi:DUF386 domain-containing protein [Rhodobacteraceae bacterium RKSG542]|uniref:YhcH/YjgK/YiaL family protein n=1 Tax=Pseudovibrio flavus TaxID=2529854 RepID=UPI0012BBAC3C|nr:YhcH/YjgK/YiaL family protein [Pseudovibrio flavus]MTI17257.1 DUF386 domain-containing protein [Pseudovibrio flavus]
MLSANLDHLETVPYIHPDLLQFILQAKDFLAMKPEAGRHELVGDKLFILVMETEVQPLEQRRPELHEKYLDVQILLEGEEILGYGHMPTGPLTEDKLAEKDVAFTAMIENEKFIRMAPRDFAVFYPAELHRPQVSPSGETAPVRKAVLKIHRDLLA